MKKLGIGLLVVIVLIAGALYYVLTNVNSIVKASVERYGSEATQASVKLDKVSLAFTEGRGALSGLRIGNPQGFATPSALVLGQIAVALDTSTVMGDGPIVIREVTIDRPEITYEVKGATNNLDTIRKNVSSYASSITGGASPSGAADKGNEGRKLIIENLYVRDGQIAISHTALQGQALAVPLPTIHLTNIGKDEGGATPGEVAAKVVGAITSQASQVGAEALVGKLGDVGKVVSGTAEEGVSSAGKALKGLFGQ
jgi:uncharacterized protein involved in outer membrane biogenesis